MRESPGGLSQLKEYMKCPRKWALKYILGWSPVKENSDPLIGGSAIHDLREKLLKGEKWELSSFADLEAPIYTRICKMWEAWYDYWVTQGNLDQYKILEVEKEYRYKLNNGYLVTLRVDGIIQHKTTKYIYIIDTKTTKGTIAQKTNQYEFDAQPLLYHLVPYKIKTKYRKLFRGWLTDIVSQRGKSEAKIDVTPPVLYSEQELDNFLLDLESITNDIKYSIDLYKETNELKGIFPAYRGISCLMYGKTCPYANICMNNKYELTSDFIEDLQFTKEVQKCFNLKK